MAPDLREWALDIAFKLRKLPDGETRTIYVGDPFGRQRLVGMQRSFMPTKNHVLVGTYNNQVDADALVADVEYVLSETTE